MKSRSSNLDQITEMGVTACSHKRLTAHKAK